MVWTKFRKKQQKKTGARGRPETPIHHEVGIPKIIKSISEALPNMSEFDKGYLLGSAERMVSEKEKAKKEDSGKKAG